MGQSHLVTTVLPVVLAAVVQTWFGANTLVNVACFTTGTVKGVFITGQGGDRFAFGKSIEDTVASPLILAAIVVEGADTLLDGEVFATRG